MKTRVISGIVLVVLLAAILTSGGMVSDICLCLVALIASYELSRAFALRDTRDRKAVAEESVEPPLSLLNGKAVQGQKDGTSQAQEAGSSQAQEDGSSQAQRTQSRSEIPLNGKTISKESLNGKTISKESLNGKTISEKSLSGKSLSGMEVVGYLGVVAHFLLIILTGGEPRFFIGTMIAFFFAETLIYVVRFPAYHISRLSDTIFCFLYAPVCLSFLCLIRDLKYGEWFVWLPFFAWVCDTFAYFSGRAFGKRKLCPKLSPHKTIAGAVGGFLGTTAASALYGYILSTFTEYNERVIWACLAIGASCGIFSQLGDLLASGIKRDRGIKDYGKLIPGHGGIMDRFDSVIFMTPIVYFLITTLLKLK